MIHVDVTTLEMPNNWEKRSDEYLNDLEEDEIEPDARTDYINNRSHHWRSLKAELKAISGEKCWYSEAKALSSDFHVDHFRPKGRALQLDDTERTGYWWLAFDWRNYRLAGSYPNSAHKDDDGNVRGKQDYFPLRNLDNAATDPKASLEDEEPYFIDPTIEEDVILISFDETGSVRVNTTDDWEKSRVRVSVKYYYLDNPELKDARKQVWNQCKRTIQNCGTLLRYSNVDTDLAEVLRKEYQELRDLVCSCWELAGTARACVRQFIDTTEQTDENQALLSLLRKVLEFAAVSSPKSCPHTAGQQT